MKLGELLQGLEGARLTGDPAVEILDLAYDSRQVTPGALFFAVPGLHADGASFARDALRRGAPAVIGPAGISRLGGGALVEVEDVRAAMAAVSARFFGMPARELRLVGVTGTNGKTTFTYLLESILKQAGHRPGVIGTISYRYGDRTLRPPHTTPESVDLQRILREMVRAGCTHALLEVSSHGLDYRRVDSCDFTCAAFTMLGRDHLDHHGDLESYFSAKARLFSEVLARSEIRDRFAVLNLDDPHGRRLREQCAVPVVAVGQAEGADYRLGALSLSREGISLEVRTPRGTLDLRSRLLGDVNALNVLLAAATADRLGVDSESIRQGVERLEIVPGRMQRIGAGDGSFVLVDYAHTPDALDKVLGSLRRLTPGRLITVFGCGGDRDRGKRPLMGAAAARWSDLVLVTSDNPRTELPEDIIREILQGIEPVAVPGRTPGEFLQARPGEKMYMVLADRREAIRLAVRAAGPGDTVLVAGKGHEDVQILGNRAIPFRDDQEVLGALGEIRGGESIPSDSRGGMAFGEALAFVQGRILGDERNPVFSRVTTDSRTAGPGDLFVALRGERFDGHDFVEQALRKGARGVLVESPVEPGVLSRHAAAGIQVPDTLKALGDLAAGWRRKFSVPVGVLTGSNGKTTAKEMTVSILRVRFSCLSTPGNFNNRIGLPLTLLGLGPEHQRVVLEMGMNEPGEIRTLTQISRPQAGVLLNVGPAHLGRFPSLEAVSQAKAEMLEAMPGESVFVFNRDDPRVRAMAERWPGPKTGYGLAVGCEVSAVEVVEQGARQRFRLRIREEVFPVEIGAPGRHSLYNALAAAALAHEMGARAEDIREGLLRFQGIAGRFLVQPRDAFTLVDDSYNANPLSMQAALETLAGMSGAAGRILVLGDMLELGDLSAEAHLELGRQAGGLEPMLLCLTGEFSKGVEQGALEQGLAPERVVRFDDPQDLAARLLGQVGSGEWILVKGSHGMALERVVNALLAGSRPR